MLLPEVFDKQKKANILEKDFFKNALDQLSRDRDYYLSTPIEPVPFNLYNSFFVDGNRQKFEKLYFTRRGRLSCFAMNVLLYNRSEDMTALEDAIWAVCDEFSWVLPAHIKDLGNKFNTNTIDLFSAETAFTLSEIVYMFRDKLNEKIITRIRENLKRRIFDVFENNSFWWETASMNWAAVCAGSVGMAYMYAAPERFDVVKKRLINTMTNFMKGYGKDGICLEGIGYWYYGFGFFVYFADALLKFTNGEINLFDIPNCHETAKFGQRVFLIKNYTVSFSDGEQRNGFLPGMTYRLKRYFNDISIIDPEYAVFDDQQHRFGTYIRNFFWAEPDNYVKGKIEREKYFPSSGWYIKNVKNYSLAAKAGCNAEPHNHNDIGSFILMDNNGQILCDFGAGEYTRQYFSPDTRYTFLTNASSGHSVPIINGYYQKEGSQYSGTVLKGKGEFCAEISRAYPKCTLNSLKRTLKLTDKLFSLTDLFSFENKENSVVERLITQTEPTIHNGTVYIKNYELHANTEDVALSKKTIKDHSGKETNLYLIDYKINSCMFTLSIAL